LPFWAAVGAGAVDGTEGELEAKGLLLDGAGAAGSEGAVSRLGGWETANAVAGGGRATGGGGGAKADCGIGAGEAKAEAVGVGKEKSAGVLVPLRDGSDGCLLDARDEDWAEPSPSVSTSRLEEARVEV